MAVPYFFLNQRLKKLELLRCRHLQQRIRSLGLHPNQLPILEYIDRNSGCTQVELSRDLALTPAAVALATKRLQKQGLIQKEADPRNLRQNLLTLTEEGRGVRRESRALFDQFDRMLYGGIPEADLETFRRCLDRMTMNLTGEETNEVNREVMTALLRQVTEEREEIFDE